MNIGIISSGNENILLFKYLNRYNHNYILYYDQNNNFLGDKDFDHAKEIIKKSIEQLIQAWCEKIIIDPIFELYFLQKGEYSDNILPLFTGYLHNYCFAYSLVGKFWLLGDFASIQEAQTLITNESKSYQLSTNQKTIKKFHLPFKYRAKEVRMWKYFLNNLSFSNFMVNKVIKFDLRYFKNADVDTIIPLNYWYFAYQRTINKYFNFNKQRFHNSKSLEKILEAHLTANQNKNQEDNYTITVLHNGHTQFLHDNKHLLWLLQKGKTAKIKYVEVKK